VLVRRAEDHAPAPATRLDPAPAPARAGKESRHGPIAQLLISWSPLSLIVVGYLLAQWVNAPLTAEDGASDTNRWGFGLHVAGPADLDHALLGTNLSAWLQARLYDGSAHWYDAVAALVYVTHLVAIPLATTLVWFRLRERFVRWVVVVLAFTLVGMGGYVLYPAAPPWLASREGDVGTVHRISSLGWDFLHLDPVRWLTETAQAGSNPVAAMPSLHAGSALLVAVFLWPSAGAAWRAVLAGYALLMAVTLVYTGEHYVVDVLAGWLVAGVACAVGAVVLRSARAVDALVDGDDGDG
jgi:membrane-associated phospholipid phosphatase